MAWSKSQQEYAHSSKGKLARERYQKSPKGIEARKKYMERRKQKLEQKAIEMVARVDNWDKQKEVKQQPKLETKKEEVKKPVPNGFTKVTKEKVKENKSKK